MLHKLFPVLFLKKNIYKKKSPKPLTPKFQLPCSILFKILHFCQAWCYFLLLHKESLPWILVMLNLLQAYFSWKLHTAFIQKQNIQVRSTTQCTSKVLIPLKKGNSQLLLAQIYCLKKEGLHHNPLLCSQSLCTAPCCRELCNPHQGVAEQRMGWGMMEEFCLL